MNEYRFLGVNVWTYSDKRALAWFGRKGSHYSDRERYMEFQVGRWGSLGVEVTVGGEDREIMLRLGLGLATLYVSLINIVPDRYLKAKEIAEATGKHAYQLDYSAQGRTTGLVFEFRHRGWVRASFWNNSDEWTNRSIIEKLRRFPYCEGLSKSFYLRHPR